MIKQERRNRILEILAHSGSVEVSQLMALFKVSIETVRRDLEDLEQQQQLVRVYGGAIVPPAKSAEPVYQKRESANYPQKEAIGKMAAELVNDGDTIAIDLGTTTMELAKALKQKKQLTIITNSLKIAALMAENPSFQVILPGGRVRHGDQALSGSLTARMLSELNTDYAFIGVGGFSLQQGITDYHMEEAMIRKVMVEHCQKLVVLFDHSKVGVVAMNQVCPLSAIDIAITDDETDPSLLRKLGRYGVNVLVAKPPQE